jgi:hypothetical protein
MRTVTSQQTKMPATHIQLIPADIDYDDIFLLVTTRIYSWLMMMACLHGQNGLSANDYDNKPVWPTWAVSILSGAAGCEILCRNRGRPYSQKTIHTFSPYNHTYILRGSLI